MILGIFLSRKWSLLFPLSCFLFYFLCVVCSGDLNQFTGPSSLWRISFHKIVIIPWLWHVYTMIDDHFEIWYGKLRVKFSVTKKSYVRMIDDFPDVGSQQKRSKKGYKKWLSKDGILHCRLQDSANQASVQPWSEKIKIPDQPGLLPNIWPRPLLHSVWQNDHDYSCPSL